MQRSEISYNFQISSVLLFDLLPRRAHRSQRIGGLCCKGCLSRKCLCGNPLLCIFYFTPRESHMHSQIKGMHAPTQAQTTHREADERTAPVWCTYSEVAVWGQGHTVSWLHSHNPLCWLGERPANGWHSPNGDYCLNVDSWDSHSPPPCVKSITHGLYNPSTWLIKPQQSPLEEH